MRFEPSIGGALGAIAMALSPFGMPAEDCHEMMEHDAGREMPGEQQQEQPMGCHAVCCRRSAESIVHKKR